MAKKPTQQKPKAKPKGAAKPKPAHKKPTTAHKAKPVAKHPPARVMHAAHKAKPVAKRPATARRPIKPASRQAKGKRKVRSQQLVMAQDYGLTLASLRAQDKEIRPAMEPGRKIRMFFVMASPEQ